MEDIKEIRQKYYNLLIYSLENDYKKWNESYDEKSYYCYISPKYGGSYGINFIYTPSKGCEVKFYIDIEKILFKSYNPWSKKRILQSKMCYYQKNKSNIEKREIRNKEFESRIQNEQLKERETQEEYKRNLSYIEKELEKNKEYLQFIRRSKLKRING